MNLCATEGLDEPNEETGHGCFLDDDWLVEVSVDCADGFLQADLYCFHNDIFDNELDLSEFRE